MPYVVFNDDGTISHAVYKLDDSQAATPCVKVCDTWCILVAEDAGYEFPDPENVTVREGVEAFNVIKGHRNA